jgi:DNA replication licensing factor MCM3
MQDTETVLLSELLQLVNESLSTEELFGTGEATEACQVMQEAEELMISDGIVYKI